MPPANIDATIILLDIGKNVNTLDDNDETFYSHARACVSRIVERKIISRPKDLLAVILMGTKSANNRLYYETDDFRHIMYLTAKRNDEGSEVVAIEPPTWDLLSKLPEKATKYEADWFEGLIVAADAFKNGLYGTKVTSKKIVLMTNFAAPVNFGENFDKVINGFKTEGFEVNIIGPNLENSKLDKETLSAALSFVEATDGITTTFQDAMRYLLFHRTKSTKPSPWNVELCIGPHIKIPISAYGRIRDTKVIQKWAKAYIDPVTNMASTTDGVVMKQDFFRNEDRASIEPHEILTGYQYGQTLVPFSDTDKTMLYDSGVRGLQIYGFTDANKVQWQNLGGDGVSYIFGRNGDIKAQKAIQCLVRALHELNVVGIARRVYNNGNAPTMFALFPCVDEGFYCLSSVAVIFKDDIKSFKFPTTNLKRYDPSQEEIDTFKSLIDSMDLMSAYEGYDDQEALPILQTVNPSIQYVLDCIAFRAVNPFKPVPLPRDDIMTLFMPPDTIKKNSEKPLEKLMALLNLKEVQNKPKKPRLSNKGVPTTISVSLSDNLPTTNTSDLNLKTYLNADDDIVTYIGTVDPVGDFHKLKDSGKTLEYLSDELMGIIESLVYLNSDDDYTKAFETVRVLREESVKGDPKKFNDWLKCFKKSLAERNKLVLLQIFKAENLDLIVNEENSLSAITKKDLEDEDPIYEVNTIPNSAQLTIQSEVYAMFDEM